MRGFGTLLVQRHIVVNAFQVSLVVGILLNLINQGRQFVNGLDIAWGLVLLNFAVPYCVASYSAVKSEIARNYDDE